MSTLTSTTPSLNTTIPPIPPVPPTPTPALSAEQVATFHRDGYLGPFAICTPDEMDAMRPDIEAALAVEPPDHKQHGHNRHIDQRIIWDISTHPAIINRMNCLYGPDLLLWRTNFFTKEPGDREIPWHQDFNYWPLEPGIINSAWLAIDPATVENSCVQVIPGSHRRVYQHVKSTPGMVFGEMADPNQVSTDKAINIELKPGEFFLFNERTLHHSEPNRSNKRRMGVAIRVIIPIVRVLDFDAPSHRLIQITGRDYMGFNALTTPPTPPPAK